MKMDSVMSLKLVWNYAKESNISLMSEVQLPRLKKEAGVKGYIIQEKGLFGASGHSQPSSMTHPGLSADLPARAEVFWKRARVLWRPLHWVPSLSAVFSRLVSVVRDQSLQIRSHWRTRLTVWSLPRWGPCVFVFFAFVSSAHVKILE